MNFNPLRLPIILYNFATLIHYSYVSLLILEAPTFFIQRTKQINYFKNKESDKKSNILSE